ncbi:MAG: CPBP family intramembrane metalloprotease [Clostridiaceae bacterium]|jgi:membrane protease YdiL (CAAX protease family)|nr:CPBP family intramembrane metalloprotease [Clostridiaceae bacterium]
MNSESIINKNDIGNSLSKAPSLVETGLLYSIVGLLLMTLGVYVQNKNFATGILVTEYIIILIPSVLLLVIRKYNVKQILRLNPVSFLNLFIIMSIMFFSMWIVTVINFFNLWLINTIFGNVIIPPLPISETPLLVNLLLIGVSAGVCEEVMFRGVIQRSFERFGKTSSIVITAFLFGLFHMDFQKLIGTFLLGIIIGFIVYRTNSLYAGMFAHFVNNSIAVLINYISDKITPSEISAMQANENFVNDYFNTLNAMPSVQKVGVIVVWLVIVAFCSAALAGLIWAFVRNTSTTNKSVLSSSTGKVLPGILAYLPGLIIVIVVYIIIGLNLASVPLNFLLMAFRL